VLLGHMEKQPDSNLLFWYQKWTVTCPAQKVIGQPELWPLLHSRLRALCHPLSPRESRDKKTAFFGILLQV
jgi:hypothetical protein